jgi:diguanylate cyclase (GGDEF)-like protein
MSIGSGAPGSYLPSVAAPPRLRVLIVTLDHDDARMLSAVLGDHGDEPHVAEGVTDALVRLTRERFDLAYLSLSMPEGDGLALVHHVRALYPDVDVVVIVDPSGVGDSAHALALGVQSVVIRPLTGDAVLVAADRAREHRALVSERARLARSVASIRRRSATYARCASFVAQTTRDAMATHILDAVLAEVPGEAGALYLPEPGGTLVALATAGRRDRLPPRLPPSELDGLQRLGLGPGEPARLLSDGRLRVVLVGEADVAGLIDVHAPERPPDDDARDALAIVAALGAASLDAARQVEAIARGGLKDPETSAYTFAYFGDAAGREIDRAARHGRRFGLLVVGVDGLDAVRARIDAHAVMQLRRSLVDAILDAVRDSDVVARVEDDEVYVLLPETGLLGALACRRRIEQRLRGALPHALDGEAVIPVIGVSVFPSDGADLGRLLRAARRRADRARRSPYRLHGLGRLGFWAQVDALLGSEDESALGRDGAVRLHRDLGRLHDDEALVRHAAMTDVLLGAVACTVARDAARAAVPGMVYAAGDDAVVYGVAHALGALERSPLRAWVLGTADRADDPAAHLRLALDDPRLRGTTVLLALTELCGYALVARQLGPATFLALHGADLDLVDGLVTALQRAYHLQPELRT